MLRQDPHNGLGALAQDTGGLLFENTNNLRQGFDRVESDLHNYYLLGYTPTNDTYDGHFRNIEVKVNGPGVTVAARKGYFAVRDTRRRAGQRLGGAGARRARAEAGAERVSRSAPARCCFPSAIVPGSSRSSSTSRPRR